MRTRSMLLWRRIQETPVELAIALVAVFIGMANMIGRTETLSIFAWWLYITLVVGGVTLFTGRLLDDSLPVQSVALSLMTGGYLFLTLRKAGEAQDAVDLTLAFLNSGAIALGLAIRLFVVRKALRLRRDVVLDALRRYHGGT